jgi:hypothetical protein
MGGKDSDICSQLLSFGGDEMHQWTQFDVAFVTGEVLVGLASYAGDHAAD